MPGIGNGPPTARVMIVGEAWGEEEARLGQPFMGTSGQELNRMLAEAGLGRAEVYVTNLINARPPQNDLTQWIAGKKKDITSVHVALLDRMVLPLVLEGYQSLMAEIKLVQPTVIIPVGNAAMWALTGLSGILKWRGSMLEAHGCKVIPTLHPAYVLRDWASRALVVADLKRAAKERHTATYENKPDWRFIVRPSFEHVTGIITALIGDMDDTASPEYHWIDLDIETRAGHIACIGLSWTKLDALCIPLMCVESLDGYWTLEQEARIVFLLYRLLTHPAVKVRWQNGLYDAQYIYRWWHFIPRGCQDTMISQHSCFAALPKSLAFLASMYCDYYVYWKDEGKTWGVTVNEEQLWAYNCQDCIYTRESGEALTQTVASLGLQEVERVQQALFYPALRAMMRGVAVSPQARSRMAAEVQEELSKREAFLARALGYVINPASPLQMCALFYEELGQKPVMKRTMIGKRMVMRPTCDDEALRTIAEREPLLKPLCNAIADIRTLGKFLNDFVLMPLDADKRMRCSFNIAGDAGGKSAPYSYRLSSSKNAFGSGGNLQTIPSDKSKSAGKSKARGSMDFTLPNIRSMYIPDPGFTFFDVDLDRADLQVVVWETDDSMLKAALRQGADIHLLNVYALDGQDPPPLEELVESHPRYPDHRGPRKHKREFAKVFCHATNYVGSAKTIAGHTGRTVHEVDRAQRQWFGAHPGIKQWHARVEMQITKYRFVENKFGYRWYIFDRLDGLLPEAVAWIPQSTVGCVINRAWLNLYNNAPEIQVLLQVHDSLAGQFPTYQTAACKEIILRECQIVVPYADPLIIPVGCKTSEISWGDCK